jgi:TusA-related sulfurtransferase
MKLVNACGRACPEPVLMTKKALAESPEGISVTVDNVVAAENIARFVKGKGYAVTQREEKDAICLDITR